MTPGAAPEHWQRVEDLLSGALGRRPADRDAFLDSACAGDPALRREVGSLLAAHERPGPVDRLAEEVARITAELQGPSAPDAGRAVGPYEVQDPIGRGGMGVVYQARDTRRGRAVALKFLQPRFDTDDAAARRFRREACTVAALRHPNICSVYEIGETEDGRLYLVMPLYEGETLQQRIARGPVPVADAVGIAAQVARGLTQAHAQGVIHRDIKPSNVFLATDGQARLLDFGIAKLADVTLTGSLAGPLGTIAYMSPEQVRSEPLDPRTDLWSLGVVLYEMLAGRCPFAMGPAGVVVNAIARAAVPPLSAHRSDLPDGLVRVVSTALAKSPDARYPSAEAFEADLLALGFSATWTPRAAG